MFNILRENECILCQNLFGWEFPWPKNPKETEKKGKFYFIARDGFFLFAWQAISTLSPKRDFKKAIAALAKFSNNVGA